MRVLVVDDDEMQLAMIERALPQFTVRCAISVADMQAIGPGFEPQIVLVDVNMPDVPEDSSVVALARTAAPAAKVVLYSAWEESKLRRLAMQLGADSYISKSVSVIGIGERLRELLKGVT
jgi:two-component system OmpR family response regulator